MATVKNCRTKCRAFLFYPGGKGPLLMGVILGVVVARAAEADAPGFGPLAVCEGPAVAAPAPESSCWFEHPLADAWEEPSEAGPSLSSLGEELLEEAGERNGEGGNNKKIKSLKEFCRGVICFDCSHYTQCTRHCIWGKNNNGMLEMKWLVCSVTDMSNCIWANVILSSLWCLVLFLLGEAAGLRGVGGGGRVGLRGHEALEPPGDREGEPVPLTASPLGTITHSSESLEGDVSLLDLGIKIFT